jgi:Kef-type K+ transport system membrane component KefB
MHSSGQLAVRLSVVLLLALVALAVAVKLDVILAAFAAGLVVRQAMRDADVRAFVAKHEGIGYGVLIPVFFIATGARFDLRALLANPLSLLLMVALLGAFLLARGLPTALLARFVDRGLPGAALATLTATQLPLVVAVTDTAVSHRAMSSAVAAAFVGAGLLSVLLYPVIALAALSRQEAGTGRAG